MKKYDFIIIGAGGAQEFAFSAAEQGLKVALIEEKHPGGTCLNRGCIPTKIMLQSAEVATYINNSEMYGIKTTKTKVEYSAIAKRVNQMVEKWRTGIFKAINSTKNLDYYNCQTKFIDNKTVIADNNKLYGNKIIVAVGMRPFIPPIPGLDKINYLTNENVLELKSLPKSIAILGGGYIGMELAHFFQSLGTKVSVIEMKPKLLSEIDDTLSEKFNEYISSKINAYTSTSLKSIVLKNKKIFLKCFKNKNKFSLTVDNLLVATGRKVNTDTLDLEKTKVKINDRGFIVSNDFLQTSNKDIYTLGDCAGTPAFRHIANYQCEILTKNLLFKKKIKPNYSITPYAVFTYPEIASVGLSYKKAKSKNSNAKTIIINYFANAKGRALGFEGFCNAVIDVKTEKILGFHIIGPYASILIHEIIPIITNNLSYKTILNSIHIHPALSELVNWTFDF